MPECPLTPDRLGTTKNISPDAAKCPHKENRCWLTTSPLQCGSEEERYPPDSAQHNAEHSRPSLWVALLFARHHAFGWGINLKQETPFLVEFTEYCILAALATPRKYLLVKCYLITCLPAKSPLDHWGQKPFFPFTAIIPTTSRRVWNTVDRWSGDVCGNERSILTESQRRGLGNCAYMWCICYIHKYLRWFTNSDKY